LLLCKFSVADGRWKVLGFWIALGVVFFCLFVVTPVYEESHQ
jgi:hypothetical protein